MKVEREKKEEKKKEKEKRIQFSSGFVSYIDREGNAVCVCTKKRAREKERELLCKLVPVVENTDSQTAHTCTCLNDGKKEVNLRAKDLRNKNHVLK